ncbi:hypothetical protein ACLOJK_015090 [Asimina triloba]
MCADCVVFYAPYYSHVRWNFLAAHVHLRIVAVLRSYAGFLVVCVTETLLSRVRWGRLIACPDPSAICSSFQIGRMPADGWLLTLGCGLLTGCFWMISEASSPFEGVVTVINGWLLKNSIAFVGFCSIMIALLHLPWPTGRLE